MNEPEQSRTLRIDGVLNARDVGGLTGELGTVRRGLVFRAACLSGLTPAGASGLARYGLRTVIDLRTALERRQEPNRVAGAPELAGVREVCVELLTTLQDLPVVSEELYRHLVERCGPGIVAVFEELATPGTLPALVHCLVGKDRTGLTVALLLDLLGVERAAILADYLESNLGLGDRAHTQVRAEILEGTLAGLDEIHGSPQGYLVAHGLTDATIRALRTALLTWPTKAPTTKVEPAR